MISPRNKRTLFRIIPFGLIWFVFSLVYTVLEKGLIGGLEHYPATGNPYRFTDNIVITPISALVAGLFTGAIEIFYLNKLFIHKSFTQKLVFKSLIYLAIIIFFLAILTALANANGLQASFFSRRVWDNVLAFCLDFAFLSVATYMAAIIVVSQFYHEVSDNMGHAVLMNFFTGKYHRPKEEERIFMFLDMTASTTIAENLGHVRYFDLLRKYYTDLSDSIIKYSGEIYQYVGDEIVVTWTLANGIRGNNCINCFFAMKNALMKEGSKYEAAYSVVPGFRAGMHYGKVTTGEIGAIKKEIIFTGDVLNTTSRIQGLCKQYDVDLLVSNPLLSRLNLGAPYKVKSFGENELRGRDQKIAVSSILTGRTTEP